MEKYSSARFCIARRKDGGTQRIDPKYTRLIVQVDINPTQTVQVDLSLVRRSLNLDLTVPDEEFAEAARQDLGGLVSRLQGLGYALVEAKLGLANRRRWAVCRTRSPARLRWMP